MSTNPDKPERTIGQLVADATGEISTIVRSEIALAKAEISSDAKAAGKGAAMFAVAGFVGLLGLIFLFHTIAYVIAIWLPGLGRLPHHDRAAVRRRRHPGARGALQHEGDEGQARAHHQERPGDHHDPEVRFLSRASPTWAHGIRPHEP